MELYLVRHGVAEPRDSDLVDADRRLTPEGEERLRRAARGLERLGVRVESVLASPYARAWDTAEILHDELGWPAPVASDALAPPASPADGVHALGGRDDGSIALVGHEPNLSELASFLLTGDEDLVQLALRKAGVIALAAPYGPVPGSCALVWSATPRMLRRLAR